jgi:hypothetical protein
MPRDEHLKNTHKLERKMENKQEAQGSKIGMTPNRFHQVQAMERSPNKKIPFNHLKKNHHFFIINNIIALALLIHNKRKKKISSCCFVLPSLGEQRKGRTI